MSLSPSTKNITMAVESSTNSSIGAGAASANNTSSCNDRTDAPPINPLPSNGNGKTETDTETAQSRNTMTSIEAGTATERNESKTESQARTMEGEVNLERNETAAVSAGVSVPTVEAVTARNETSDSLDGVPVTEEETANKKCETETAPMPVTPAGVVMTVATEIAPSPPPQTLAETGSPGNVTEISVTNKNETPDSPDKVPTTEEDAAPKKSDSYTPPTSDKTAGGVTVATETATPPPFQTLTATDGGAVITSVSNSTALMTEAVNPTAKKSTIIANNSNCSATTAAVASSPRQPLLAHPTTPSSSPPNFGIIDFRKNPDLVRNPLGYIILAFEEVRCRHPDLFVQLCRKWLTADIWAMAINSRIINLPSTIYGGQFNRAFTKLCAPVIENNFISSSNPSGIIRIKRGEDYFYYVLECKATWDDDSFQPPERPPSKNCSSWITETKKVENDITLRLRKMPPVARPTTPPSTALHTIPPLRLGGVPSGKIISDVVIRAFEEVRCNHTDLCIRFCRRWVTADGWSLVISSRIANLRYKLDRIAFNHAFDEYDKKYGPNGVHDNFSTNNPLGVIRIKRGTEQFYYVLENKKRWDDSTSPPAAPPMICIQSWINKTKRDEWDLTRGLQPLPRRVTPETVIHTTGNGNNTKVAAARARNTTTGTSAAANSTGGSANYVLRSTPHTMIDLKNSPLARMPFGFVILAFEGVRYNHPHLLCQKWASASAWAAVINAHIANLPHPVGKDAFNRTFEEFEGRNKMYIKIHDNFSSKNQAGIIRIKRFKDYFYYVLEGKQRWNDQSFPPPRIPPSDNPACKSWAENKKYEEMELLRGLRPLPQKKIFEEQEPHRLETHPTFFRPTGPQFDDTPTNENARTYDTAGSSVAPPPLLGRVNIQLRDNPFAMTPSGIVILAFEEVRRKHPDLYTKFCQKWVTADTWALVLNYRIANLPKPIDRDAFNDAFSTFNGCNGKYRSIHNNFSSDNPAGMIRIKRGRDNFYFVLECKRLWNKTSFPTPHVPPSCDFEWIRETKKEEEILFHGLPPLPPPPEPPKPAPTPFLPTGFQFAPLQKKKFGVLDLKNNPVLAKSPFGLAILAFEEVRCRHADLFFRLCRKWVTADAWVLAIASRIANFPIDVAIDRDTFNAAFGKFGSYNIDDNFSSNNQKGIIRIKRGAEYFYYVLECQTRWNDGSFPPPENPPKSNFLGGTTWKREVKRIQQKLLDGITPLPRPERDMMLQTKEELEQALPAAKRQKTAAAVTENALATGSAASSTPTPSNGGTSELTLPIPPTEDTATPETPMALHWKKLAIEGYWLSGEAKRLFCPRDGESVKEALQRRIKLLQKVNMKPDGWREVIEGGDPENWCQPIHIQQIQQKCLFLCQAYHVALLKMGSRSTNFKGCCTEACERLKVLGFLETNTPNAIIKWNNKFRTADLFPHPNPAGNYQDPYLLRTYPAIKFALLNFWWSKYNLKAKNAMDCYRYLVQEGPAPRCFELEKKRRQERNLKVPATMEAFLSMNQCRKYMKRYGLRYNEPKRYYYWVKTEQGERAKKDAAVNCYGYGDNLHEAEEATEEIVEKEILPEPRFLKHYPAIKEALLEYCRKNRKNMSASSAHIYLMEGPIAEAYNNFIRQQSPQEGPSPTMEEWFWKFKLKRISPTSVINWAKLYGYRYNRKKHYWYFLGEKNDEGDNDDEDDDDDDDDGNDTASIVTSEDEDEDDECSPIRTNVMQQLHRHPSHNQEGIGGQYNFLFS